MKVVKLVSELLFLTSVFSTCYGEIPVTVLCSMDWFMVTVQPFMWNDDVYVHFYELHLGLGCPVNHVQTHIYQFTYRVTECGIRIKAIFQDVVIYSSEIHYASKDTSSKYVIPVSCAAPRRSPWLTMPHSTQGASQNVTMANSDETPHQVSGLAQANQRAHCDCRFCIFNEQHVQDPGQQAEAPEAFPEQLSDFPNISED
ncbi:placenta-specific protein 1 [Cavia porcellus]|uniref:placenta-specific protein 1 n=1 Tax=Cavia porcellus TaxID=10141 RepID=UPI000661FA12|nr:placenta-specific protein 1 [Cavia porcellus]